MWSPQQETALSEVERWLRGGSRQVFRLFGYAGTGKTTLAKHLAEGVDGDVRFAAYTGKAAQVLREKGCRGASTIHSLIYRAKEKSRTKLRELEEKLVRLQAQGADELTLEKTRKEIKDERALLSRPTFELSGGDSLRDTRLLILDECSMIDDRMGQDLLSLGIKVLVLGDPAQLPPVRGSGFFVDGHEPDFLLTEIHRQAQDNPILHLASLVREGKSLTPGDYGDSRVVKSRDLEPGSSLTHEQVLVGKNATRRLTNRRFRESLGKEGPWPVEGEKLICLRNNHDLGLLNGSLWKTVATTPGPEDGRLLLTIEGLGGEAELSTEAHEFHFLGHSPEAMPWWERCEADEFDYGYAITVHKSQGSQWDNVMVIDEWWQRDTRARWLYTAVTRAAKRLTLVQMT